jgi:hypothetical protein
VRAHRDGVLVRAEVLDVLAAAAADFPVDLVVVTRR